MTLDWQASFVAFVAVGMRLAITSFPKAKG